MEKKGKILKKKKIIPENISYFYDFISIIFYSVSTQRLGRLLVAVDLIRASSGFRNPVKSRTRSAFSLQTRLSYFCVSSWSLYLWVQRC